MLRRVIVLLGLAAGLLLASASPASAVQPYPLNFQTVDFTSGTLDGLAYQDGKLKLAGNGAGIFDYTDPFSSVTVLGQQRRRLRELRLRHVDVARVPDELRVQRAGLVLELEDARRAPGSSPRSSPSWTTGTGLIGDAIA